MQANDGLEKSTSGEFEENGRRKETNMDIKRTSELSFEEQQMTTRERLT